VLSYVLSDHEVLKGQIYCNNTHDNSEHINAHSCPVSAQCQKNKDSDTNNTSEHQCACSCHVCLCDVKESKIEIHKTQASTSVLTCVLHIGLVRKGVLTEGKIGDFKKQTECSLFDRKD